MPVMSRSGERPMATSQIEDLAWEEPQSPNEIVDELIREHGIERLYVLYSGGKDSNSVDHFISENYPDQYGGRVFTNTTIADPSVRKFVIADSHKRGKPLHLVWPKKTYYDIVINNGFPRAGVHFIIMTRLKYSSWRDFLKEKLKAGEKAAFVSGVRKKESWARSKRRMYTKKPIYQDGKLVFVMPFLYKNGEQLTEYFYENGLSKSPAYEYGDISGECLCGCFAQPWELKGIQMGAPLVFQTIAWMEREIQAKIKRLEGSADPKDIEVVRRLRFAPKWGRGGVSTDDVLQQSMIDGEANPASEDFCGESCGT